MASFVFDKPTPTVGFATPTKVRLTQADAFEGPYSQTGVDQLLSSLPDNPEDANQYVVTEPLALDTKFTRIYLVTDGGVAGDSAVLEPKIATPDSFQIFAYSVDAGLGILEGVILDVAPIGGVATAGSTTVISRAEDISDGAGRASIDSVPADSGKYYVNFGGERKIIDSTGIGGTSINWKDIVS